MKKLDIKILILFGMDLFFIIFSYLLASLLINNFVFVRLDIIAILSGVYWIVPIYAIFLYIFQLYKSLWQYASIEEAMNVFYAVLLSFSVMILVKLMFGFHLGVNEIIVANILIFMLLTFNRYGLRVLRIIRNYKVKNDNDIRTLIIGAGNAANLVIKEIKNNIKLNHKAVCLVDDDEMKTGKFINGIEVGGTTADLKSLVRKYRVDEIIIALPSADKAEITSILGKCKDLNKKIRILPPFYEVIDKKFSYHKIRDVQIEELLGREEVKIDSEGLFDFINNEVVLVTGGGGSIGSELCRQIIKYEPKQLLILDIYENNAYDIQNELIRKINIIKIKTDIHVLIASVRDEERIDEIFSEYKPTIVFHAAAHKHVPLMETSPKEAIKNNVFGTYNVVKISDKYNVKKFVLISTDKAVNPTNIMGATKRMAEMIIQAFDKESKTQFAAVRFGNVLGSNGSVIPLFKKQIKEGGPVTVTHKDIIRYFMTIPEAVQLVMQAGAFAKGGEIFVLDMGEPVKILDLAEKLISHSGFEPYNEIDITFTGLRPGEKLYEELLMSEEGLTKTENKKIFVLTQIDSNMNEINKKLVELKDFINCPNIDVQKEFNKFVPTYSKVEQKLDENI